jgi:abhydrolase domain-containing protein 12
LNIHTPDNVTLGAWLTFAEPAFQSLRSARRPLPNPDSQDIHSALNRYKTVIFFHGNGGSRAAPFRRQLYTAWSSKLAVNVLAIDYRGYGDSEGSPSEEGLAIDGRAAWDWAIANGARPDSIVLVGQSLGTGVAAKVAHRLSREGTISSSGQESIVDRFRQGVEPRGVVLIAGFTSIAKLLETYNMAGFLPLMQPLQLIPMAFSM